jgi:hypothetical protein
LKFLCTVPLLLLILCVTTTINAQTPAATISGVVVDPSGKVVPKAEILIFNEATGIRYPNTTNDAGIYAVSILPPGQYRIQVSRDGFKTIVKPGVILNVQSAIALNFTLPLGATSETVTVDAGTSSINTDEASVSTVVDRKFVENMPLNGRSFQDLISMTPGVVTQSPQTRGAVQSMGDFSVNGQRTESNYYTVDGVSANTGAGAPTGYGQVGTSGSVAGSTALGTTQSLVSVDALQEFRVSSSTYSAEYGRSPGGQFSLSTRSGTNRFGGTAFDYLRNDIFDANDWFNNHNGIARTALRQNDFGGTLGGPIILPRIYKGTDRSFFFFSYEGLRLIQPVAATTQYVPALGVRSASAAAVQPIFNAFPVPTGSEIEINGSPSGLSPFVSAYSLPSRIDSTSIRLDHSITSHMSVFFRFANTPSYAQTRNLSAVSNTDVNSRTYTAGVTNQFSGRRSNELRFGYVSSSSSINEYLDSFGGATPIDMSAAMGVPGATKFTDFYPYITITGVGYSTIEQTNSASRLRQWNLTDTVSLTFGRHQLRVGIDERRIHSPLTPSSPYGGVDYYDRDSMIQNVAGDGAIAKVVSSEPIFQEFAAFAQDDWRLSRSVSLALGLRWEVNPPPTEAHVVTSLSLPDILFPDRYEDSGSPELPRDLWVKRGPRLRRINPIRGDGAWHFPESAAVQFRPAVSPDGSAFIAAKPAAQIPTAWTGFQFASDKYRFEKLDIKHDPSGLIWSWPWQYVYVNPSRHEVFPLVDAIVDKNRMMLRCSLLESRSHLSYVSGIAAIIAVAGHKQNCGIINVPAHMVIGRIGKQRTEFSGVCDTAIF